MRALLLILIAALPALAQGGGTVSGRMVDEDGRPIAGAFVGEVGFSLAETDAEGGFSFHVRYGTRATFHVGHREFVGTTFLAEIPSSGHEVVMKRGLAIAGSVTFPDGTPIADAAVRISPVPKNHWPRGEVRTGPGGAFRFTGLAVGEEFGLTCFGVRARARVGEEGVVLRIEHSLILFSVRDGNGRPLGVEHLCRRGGRSERYVRIWTGFRVGTGEFLFPAGDSDLVLVSPVVPDHEMPVVEVSTRGMPRLIRAGVMVRPLASPARLALLVRDANNTTPDRVHVTLRNAAGATPVHADGQRVRVENGIATIEGLPPGDYRIWVRPEDGCPGYRLAAAARAVLSPGETVERHVVLPLGGRMRIEVLGISRIERWNGQWGIEILDAAGNLLHGKFPRFGEWSLPDGPVPVGQYQVRVRRRDKVVVEEPIEIEASQVTSLRITVPN